MDPIVKLSSLFKKTTRSESCLEKCWPEEFVQEWSELFTSFTAIFAKVNPVRNKNGKIDAKRNLVLNLPGNDCCQTPDFLSVQRWKNGDIRLEPFRLLRGFDIQQFIQVHTENVINFV